MSIICKKNLTLVRPHEFSILPQSILMSPGPEKAAAFMDNLYICLKLLLSPCGEFHNRIMSVFNEVLLEGTKITVIQYWYLRILL